VEPGGAILHKLLLVGILASSASARAQSEPDAEGNAPEAEAAAASEAETPASAAEPAPPLRDSLPASKQDGEVKPEGDTKDPASREVAEELPSQPDELLEVHAFVSQGAMWSTDNNYLALSEGGTFEFAEAGINVTRPISERLRAGIQLYARDLGPNENYDARFDWFYLDYRFEDWLGLRAGRAKTPFGLFNESNDVDAARTFVLLPQSVYPTASRDFLLAVTGFHLYGFVPIGAAGALDYRLYAGTNHLAAASRPSSPIQVDSLSTRYVVGGQLMWELPVEGLRLGGSAQKIKIDGSLAADAALYQSLIDSGDLDPTFSGVFGYDLGALLGVVSLEYERGDLHTAAEFSRWMVDLDSDLPVLLPRNQLESDRFHVMASYHVAPWLTPGAYYAALFPNIDNRKGRENYQHDLAATLRFDLTANWLLKVEGHFMRGTADLNSSLNGNRPKTELERDWALLLGKTTVYF
jgi:hypothetical protein